MGKREIKHVVVSKETHDNLSKLAESPDGGRGKTFDTVLRELLALIGIGNKTPE